MKRALVALLVVAGCSFPGRTRFTDLCGDGVVDPGEQCDDGTANSDDGPCTPTCRTYGGGDGTVEPSLGEQCDDGSSNGEPADPCSATCQRLFCGDGIVQTGFEQCDDGSANGAPTGKCSATCQKEFCGDGIVEPGLGEQCDDGNTDDDDNCTNSCLLPFCGDGIVWNQGSGTEQCDNGSANSDSVPNACRTDCTLAHCGDGVVDTGEQCDDGLANSDTAANACRTDCLLAHCGDGVGDSGEQCDTGSAVGNADDCTAACQLARCGDGFDHTASDGLAGADGIEACDGGSDNTLSLDGCSPDCSFTLDAPMLVATGAGIDAAAIAVDGFGDLAVVFDEGAPRDIRLVVWDPNGVRLTPAGGVVVNTTTGSDHTEPAIAARSSGGFTIAWTDSTDTAPDVSISAIRARRANADGSFFDASDFVVNAHTAGGQRTPAVATLGSDVAAIFFVDQEENIAERALGEAGFLDGSDVTVASQSPTEARLMAGALPDGEFAAAWGEVVNCDGDSEPCDVDIERFAADRTPLDATSRITNNHTQNFPETLVVGNGGYLVIYAGGENAPEDPQPFTLFFPPSGSGGELGAGVQFPLGLQGRDDFAGAVDTLGNWFFAVPQSINAGPIELHRMDAAMDGDLAGDPIVLMSVAGATSTAAPAAATYRSSVAVAVLATMAASQQVWLVVAPPVP